MADSDLLRSERGRARLATGYTIGPAGPRAVVDREWVTAGRLVDLLDDPRDMSRYVAALLGGGTNEHGTVLRPATLAMMFAPHYQPRSARAGDRPRVRPGHRRRASRRRARRDPARLQLADLRGSRRWRRGDRVHERSPAGDAVAADGGLPAAQPACSASRTTPSGPTSPTIPRPGASCAAGTGPRPAHGYSGAAHARRRRRGLRPWRTGCGSGAEPAARPLPRVPAPPGRPGGPGRVPGRPRPNSGCRPHAIIFSREPGRRDDGGPPRHLPASPFAGDRHRTNPRVWAMGAPRGRSGVAAATIALAESLTRLAARRAGV